jgi:hypothetical protein
MGDSSEGMPINPATQGYSSSGPRTATLTPGAVSTSNNTGAASTTTPDPASTSTNQQLREANLALQAENELWKQKAQRLEAPIAEQIDQHLRRYMPALCELKDKTAADAEETSRLKHEAETYRDQAHAANEFQQLEQDMIRDWAQGKSITLEAKTPEILASLMEDDPMVQSMLNTLLVQHKHESELEAQSKDSLSSIQDELKSEQARKKREFTGQFWTVYDQYENKLTPALREQILALKPELIKQKYALDDPLVKEMRDEDFGAGYLQAMRDTEYQAWVGAGEKVPAEFDGQFDHLQSDTNENHPFQIGLRVAKIAGFRLFCFVNDGEFQTSQLDRSLSDRQWTAPEQFRTLSSELPSPGTFYDGIQTELLRVVEVGAAMVNELEGFEQVPRKGQPASVTSKGQSGSTTSKDSKALTAVPAHVPEQDVAQHSPRAKICNYCNLKWHIAKDCYHKVIDEAFGWEKLPKINRRSQYPRPNHGENVRRYHQTHKARTI